MTATATKRAPKKYDLADLCQRQQRALELGKKWYKRADALMDEIERQMEPGQIEGRYKLVDKFASKNRINVGLNARRYELEVVEAA